VAKVTTLALELQPMMGKPSVKTCRCAVCGATWPLNQHHVVRRGAGKMYRNGVELKKPTITLCGSGNTSGCHGLAHQNRLHFRWVESRQPSGEYGMPTIEAGHWEYILLDEPTKYSKALEMEGWRRLDGRG
jgi:hypothetical protein